MASAQATEKGGMEDTYLAFSFLSMAIIHEKESHENQKPMKNQANFKKRLNQASFVHVKRSIFKGDIQNN